MKLLEELCQRYSLPLYAYARKKGNTKEKAEELTQACFIHLIRTRVFESASDAKGRLRDLLPVVFRRVAAGRNVWTKL